VYPQKASLTNGCDVWLLLPEVTQYICTFSLVTCVQMLQYLPAPALTQPQYVVPWGVGVTTRGIRIVLAGTWITPVSVIATGALPAFCPNVNWSFRSSKRCTNVPDPYRGQNDRSKKKKNCNLLTYACSSSLLWFVLFVHVPNNKSSSCCCRMLQSKNMFSHWQNSLNKLKIWNVVIEVQGLQWYVLACNAVYFGI
jgi:hypothetical protein